MRGRKPSGKRKDEMLTIRCTREVKQRFLRFSRFFETRNDALQALLDFAEDFRFPLDVVVRKSLLSS